MARKTKIEALVTRDNILDSAERLFVHQGVSRTTLQQIAQRAGVTRGAIYWHFADKAALFDAMLLRVKMPFEAALNAIEQADSTDPIGNLREYAQMVFRVTESDARAQRVFEILTLKVEFVDELAAARQRRAEMQLCWMESVEGRIRSAVRSGQAPPGLDAGAAALGLWALIDGLLRAWLIAPESFSLSGMGAAIVSAHLDSLVNRIPAPAA
jgi:TetR/AcrR family acrAB operon transcriptional repressor